MGKLSRFLFGIVLVISPLLLGSNRAIFWSFNAIIVALSLFFYVLAEWSSLRRSVSDWALPTKLSYLYILPILWMTFQLLPGVPSILAHPVWQTVPDVAGSVSINPTQTLLALVWWLAMGICFVAVRAGTKRGGAKFYLDLILTTATGVAIFGLANLYLGWDSIGLLEKSDYEGWLTGTFVNRNSAASYFVIGLAIATVQSISCYYDIEKRFAGVAFGARLFLLFSSKAAIYFAAFIILFLALLLTGSRAGLVSGICVIVLVFALSRKSQKKLGYKFPMAILIFLVGLAVSTTSILDRAQSGAGSSWARVDLTLEALKATADRPILGHGAGAYQSTEPYYHSENLPPGPVWNRAHNSLAEAFANLGVPFTLAWLFIFMGVVAQLYRQSKKNKKLMPATIVLLAVLVFEGLHGLVDFSFQIQAFALAVSALLGLSVGEVVSAQNQSGARSLQ